MEEQHISDTSLTTIMLLLQGAQAIADVVLGIVSPSGRLPTTFYYENYTSQVALHDFAHFSRTSSETTCRSTSKICEGTQTLNPIIPGRLPDTPNDPIESAILFRYECDTP